MGDKETADYYAGQYRAEYPVCRTPEQYDLKGSLTATKRLHYVSKVCLQPPGQLLDIGCATGNFIRLMKKYSWQVTGVEPDLSHSVYAREKGLNVATGMFETVELPSNYYNLVTIFHTLEHMSEPVEVLEKVRDILAPGGQVFIEVPNVNTLKFSLLKVEDKYTYFKPYHLYFFSPTTLKAVVEKAGLLVKYIETRDCWVEDKGISSVLRLAVKVNSVLRELVNCGRYICLVGQKGKQMPRQDW